MQTENEHEKRAFTIMRYEKMMLFSESNVKIQPRRHDIRWIDYANKYIVAQITLVLVDNYSIFRVPR